MPVSPTDDKPAEPAPPPTDDAFAIANYFPRGANNAALVSHITVDFSEPLLEHSFSSDLVSVSVDGSPVGGVQRLVAPSSVQFIPDTLLQPDTLYHVKVSDQVMSQSGRTLRPVEWQFRTVADVYTTSQDIIDQCMSERDIEMLASVNAARTQSRTCGEDFQAAVNKLSWSCDLQAAAISHAVDMSEQNFFSHTGSDGSSIGTRATRTGYRWSIVGENIAAGQRSVNGVMLGWLDSPGHCRNIMSPHYTQFGFGYSTNSGSFYQRYWAQAFARPR